MKKPKPGQNRAPDQRKKTRAEKKAQQQAAAPQEWNGMERELEAEYQEVLKKQSGRCAKCGILARKVSNGRLLIDDEGISGEDGRSIARLVCQKCSAEEFLECGAGDVLDFQLGVDDLRLNQASANTAALRAAVAANSGDTTGAMGRTVEAALDALLVPKQGKRTDD